MRRFKKGEIPGLEFRNALKKPIPVRCAQIDEPFEIETKEGILSAKNGDYLMIGVEGEMWAIDQQIFLKTYDIIE